MDVEKFKMTNTQKLLSACVAVGIILIGGHALIRNSGGSKLPSKHSNFNGTRTVLSNGERDRDCGDFRTQREAQEFFEANGGPTRDLHGLDRDGDGRVCESLK